MGIADCKNRVAKAGSTASKAAMPRCEMAKLIDRCCAAALYDARRISSAQNENVLTKMHGIKKLLTWTTFVKIDMPATLGERHGC